MKLQDVILPLAIGVAMIFVSRGVNAKLDEKGSGETIFKPTIETVVSDVDFTREDLEGVSDQNVGTHLVGTPNVPLQRVIWSSGSLRQQVESALGGYCKGYVDSVTDRWVQKCGIQQVEDWAKASSGGSKTRWGGIMVQVSKDNEGNVYISQ